MNGQRSRCSSCQSDIIWNGRDWRNLGHYYRSGGVWFGRKHACRPARPTCGAWMPHARERCARAAGHNYDHRTRYAMDNALERATGHRKAA